MRNILKITTLLSFVFIISCASVYNMKGTNVNTEVPKFIIKKLKSSHKDFLNNTDVIIITLKDSISNNEFVYSIYDKGSVQDIDVRPDSIKFSFNDFTEVEGKLYVWERFDSVKKPSKIYNVFNKYNVRLDSCAYKYKFLDDNLEKLTDCQKNRKSSFTDNDFSSIYYRAKLNDEKTKLVLKKMSKRDFRSLHNY